MRTILQVEDDPNEVFFLQRALNRAAVANPVHVVTDGQQAIDYLKGEGKFADREQFPMPCLVLLDLKLPFVMGFEVLSWIRQQPGMTVPVVILSSSAEDADMATAYRLGANAFLTKPSAVSELEDMVRAIKAFWLTHNSLPHEAHRERAAVSPYERTVNPGANRLPATIGVRREEWHPMMTKRRYEKSHSVTL